MNKNCIQTDVLVIGSGIGGLLTALTISKNKKVILATKSKIEKGSTNLAQGGIAIVQNFDEDSFIEHKKDTLKAGHYINNEKVVQKIISDGPEVLNILKELGVMFDDSLHLEGGHSHHRIAHVKDWTGMAIERQLVQKARATKNITILENTTAIDLIHKENACNGAIFLKNKKIIQILAANTVLATGGAGQVFLHTTNPLVSTGDGIAMAERAGVKTSDMEFVQFHPTALLESKTPHFLLSEALRGAGATLVNNKGEEIMKKYDSRGDLAPRDIVTKAIFEEMKKGKIYMQFKKPNAKIRAQFPTIAEAVQKKLHLDISHDLVPVTPVAHYLCGGIKAEISGKTSMKHLYAVGECASTGLHGANRLASNSLLEAAALAIHAAKKIQNGKREKTPTIKPNTTLKPASQKYNLNPLRKKIQKTMWENVGIRRTEEGLLRAKRELESIYSILPPQHQINRQTIETRNLLDTGLLITKAALHRKKSIGCHWRA